MNNTTESKDAKFLQDIYSNMKMGSDSVINLLPKVKNDDMKSAMTAQLDQYEKYAASVRGRLAERGATPKEANPIAKISAKVGMEMKTMQDGTTSHMAEMMIQGSTMDVTDLLQKIGEYEKYTECRESVSLAKSIVGFEERNIEKMKEFL